MANLNVEFMSSEKGHECLVVDGFEFYQGYSYKFGSLTRWKCVQKNCKAICFTDDPDSKNIIAERSVLAHNHTSKIARHILISPCKKKALEDITATPKKIVEKALRELQLLNHFKETELKYVKKIIRDSGVCHENEDTERVVPSVWGEPNKEKAQFDVNTTAITCFSEVKSGEDFNQSGHTFSYNRPYENKDTFPSCSGKSSDYSNSEDTIITISSEDTDFEERNDVEFDQNESTFSPNLQSGKENVDISNCLGESLTSQNNKEAQQFITNMINIKRSTKEMVNEFDIVGKTGSQYGDKNQSPSITDFPTGNGWLERFEQRHGIYSNGLNNQSYDLQKHPTQIRKEDIDRADLIYVDCNSFTEMEDQIPSEEESEAITTITATDLTKSFNTIKRALQIEDVVPDEYFTILKSVEYFLQEKRERRKVQKIKIENV